MNIFSDPEKIVAELPIFAGQKVADFGAGNGAYTFLLAKKVQGIQQGEVFAIDINQGLVERIGNEAQRQGITNINPLWGDIDEIHGTNLASGSVHAVVVANTLFQTEKPSAVIKEAHRVLSFEGMLIVIDWSDSFNHIGPHPDHVITKTAAILLLQENGFELAKEFDAGAHHYGLIARKIEQASK
jgi:ubiquinone/menaquinone biosynthesis C-methylase UbiE